MRLPPGETSSTGVDSTAAAVETWASALDEIVARCSFEQVVIHSREELILLSSRVWRAQEFGPLGLVCLTITSVTHSLVRVGLTSQRFADPTCAS